MYKVPLADIKEKIVASGKMSAVDLEEKIKSKINELSGLISEEGAAHIIANSLGVELVSQGKDKLKIKEIYSGMKGVTTVAKVVRKFDVHEFKKGDGVGKVCSLVIGDETGSTRLVFWNDQVNEVANLNQDDIILIKDVNVRENRGEKELHFGDRSDIEVNPGGITIENVRQGTSYNRKKISELVDGESGAEVLGTVVQIFDPRFFTVCPECNKRATESDGKFNCVEHNEVLPVLSYVMNVVLDDGSGTIRGVFWKNQTNHLLSKTEEEMAGFKDNMVSFEEVKTDLLGEQFKVMGRIKKNDMFDRLEFNAQLVEKANPDDEIKRLGG